MKVTIIFNKEKYPNEEPQILTGMKSITDCPGMDCFEIKDYCYNWWEPKYKDIDSIVITEN